MRRLILAIVLVALITATGGVLTNLAADEFKAALQARLGSQYALIVIAGTFVLAVLAVAGGLLLARLLPRDRPDPNLETKFKNIWFGPDGIAACLKLDLQVAGVSLKEVRAAITSDPAEPYPLHISAFKTPYQFTQDDWRIVRSYSPELGRVTAEYIDSIQDLRHSASRYKMEVEWPSRSHDVAARQADLQRAEGRVEKATNPMMDKLEHYDRMFKDKSA